MGVVGFVVCGLWFWSLFVVEVVVMAVVNVYVNVCVFAKLVHSLKIILNNYSCPAGMALMEDIVMRFTSCKGAALLIDYGTKKFILKKTNMHVFCLVFSSF